MDFFGGHIFIKHVSNINNLFYGVNKILYLMLFHIVFYCFKNQDQEIYLLCEMTTVIDRNSSAAAVVGWKGQDSMGHKKTRLFHPAHSKPFSAYSVPTLGRHLKRVA